MAVNTYKKSDNTALSENFMLSEFACKGKGCCDEILVDDELVSVLQKIRSHFKKAVIINSGFRCKTHNKAVGGTSKSQHLSGKACDITVKGVEPKKVAEYAEQLKVRGIILYPDKGFVHIDTRAAAYRAITSNSGTVSVKSFLNACPYNKPSGLVRRGSKGEGTKWVQWNLNKLGFSCGEVDGICGAKTVKAIISFQSKNGLLCDGICGKNTVSKIEALI